jgi:hypothetical protein
MRDQGRIVAESGIEWEVLRLDGTKHLLRNTGTCEAREVSITSNDQSVSRVGGSDTVFPGGAVLFDVNSAPESDLRLTISWLSAEGQNHSREIPMG